MSFARGFALGATAASAAGATGLFLSSRRQEQRHQLYAAFGMPVPSVAPVLTYPHHALAYDPVRKVPLWVAERLSTKHVRECQECDELAPSFGTVGEKVSRSKAIFRPDPALPAHASANNSDYFRSGWSRGHMAPAGDNKHSQEAMNATFLLTNILPQDMKNNGGYWNMIELWARDLTDKFDQVSIISGPVFRSATEEESGKSFVKYQVIGDNRVAVPTHLYKVVVGERAGRPPLVSAFIVPNARVPLATRLEDFEVPLGGLEAEVGFRLLPKLPGAPPSLCASPLGCRLMPARDFLKVVYARQLPGARKLHWLERLWRKVIRDGLDSDEELRALYETRRRELEAKEAQVPSPVHETQAPSAAEPTPVAAAG